MSPKKISFNYISFFLNWRFTLYAARRAVKITTKKIVELLSPCSTSVKSCGLIRANERMPNVKKREEYYNVLYYYPSRPNITIHHHGDQQILTTRATESIFRYARYDFGIYIYCVSVRRGVCMTCNIRKWNRNWNKCCVNKQIVCNFSSKHCWMSFK